MKEYILALLETPRKRFATVSSVFAGGLLLTLIIALPTWLKPPTFPGKPLFNLLKQAGAPFDHIHVFVLGIFLVLFAWQKRPHLTGSAVAFLFFLFFLYDQFRWAPPFELYALLFVALLYGWFRPHAQTLALKCSMLTIAGLYFWSGVQKINVTFFTVYMRDLLAPFAYTLSPSFMAFLSLPILATEIAIGIGLVTTRFRNAALLLACLLHCGIMLFMLLGVFIFVPAVFIWNILLVALLVGLFWQEKTDINELLRLPTIPKLLLILFFFVLPIASIVGPIDTYWGFGVVNGRRAKITDIQLSEETSKNIPPSLQKMLSVPDDGNTMFSPQLWSYRERRLFLYPETRAFIHVFSHFCALVDDAPEVSVRIAKRPSLFSAYGDVQIYTCADM